MSEQKIEELVDELSKLSVLDMSKLKKALEEKWDVKAAAGGGVVMAAPAAGGDAGGAADESTEFNVILADSPADKKIAVIKEIRAITGLGLKEAKELVESTPKPVKEGASKADAEDIKKKLEAIGAKVELKGV